ncbi:MAG: threonine/serine dehydratase [Gammaproteobacteria bacterium]|jgi:threonine dehydratase
MKMLDIKKEVIRAESSIKKYIRYTPLVRAHQLSLLCDANVYLKLENIQCTSAFKVRGAFNKLLSLTDKQKQQEVVTASTGNHGAAVAYAGQKLGIKTRIFVPNSTSEMKINAIKSYNAEVSYLGEECGATEKYAREFAEKNGLVYVSPYNDIKIIGGQGTIGYEIVQQLDKIDEVFVAVGGGGLISGIGGYLKEINSKITVTGCLPQNSPVMAESIKLGKIIEMDTKPTLSDSTAGNIDLDAITFGFCKKYVDDYILVTEDEIKQAMCLFMEKEHMLIEGAVGVVVASMLKRQKFIKNKNIVLIICGANISMDTLKKVIC